MTNNSLAISISVLIYSFLTHKELADVAMQREEIVTMAGIMRL